MVLSRMMTTNNSPQKKTIYDGTLAMKSLKGPKKNTLLVSYFIHHVRVFIASLGHLTRNPLASLMTSAVIAIALALPANMFIAINNVSDMSVGWDSSTIISLFLKTSISDKQAEDLAKQLRLHKDIESIKITTKEQGLKTFKELSGFGDALKYLTTNPLPVVIKVKPVIDPQRPDKINHLVAELRNKKEVEIAQLDMQWVKRLYSILALANQGVWIIGSLLALAVLLIIGNTIRLDIQNRREEIEVAKLIGASNAFIRRPFLYTGLWYGLSGGMLAWLLTTVSLQLLSAPVQQLANQYDSNFHLVGLSLDNALLMVAISCLLGLGGSWMAVGRHLSEIEPT